MFYGNYPLNDSSLEYTTFVFSILVGSYLLETVSFICMCVCHMCEIPMVVRSVCQIPWSELLSPVKAASAF